MGAVTQLVMKPVAKALGLTPKKAAPAPAAPAAKPETPPPSVDTQAVKAAGETERRRARAAAGRASTMLTGSRGLTDSATTATKKLLGQ